jgi:sugar O-acyltransferase (sialic acid O-acetyltransferase NeuD family)/putative phosphoesterase
MTTLAIIADIHGNAPALDAVIKAVGDQADAWLCAGDIAGHLPMVDEVIARLRQLGAYCVMGNHDYALTHNLPIANSLAASWAIQKQRVYVSSQSKHFLASLSEKLELEFEGKSILLAHGGPNDYLHQRIASVDRGLLDAFQSDILIVGNRHRPLIYVDTLKTVLNPGSVGLPSDGEKRARVILLALPSGHVRLLEISYDPAPLFRSMYELGYDERYFNCLKAGRWVGFSNREKRVPIIIAGASLYGEMVAELIDRTTDMRVVGFVDDSDGLQNRSTYGYPVLGRIGELSQLGTETGVTDVAVAIGDNLAREQVADRVKAQGMRLATLVHSQATVSPSTKLGPGVIVDAQSFIGPHCILEEGVSVWPSASISHDTILKRYSSVKPGAILGGCSTVEERVKIPLGTCWQSFSTLTAGIGDVAKRESQAGVALDCAVAGQEANSSVNRK